MSYHGYGTDELQIHTPKINVVKTFEIRLDLFLTKKTFFQLIKFKKQKKKSTRKSITNNTIQPYD